MRLVAEGQDGVRMVSSSPRVVLSVTVKAEASQLIALKFSMVASFPQDAYWAAVLPFLTWHDHHTCEKALFTGRISSGS